MSRLMPWVWYPAFLSFGVGAFAAMIAGGASPAAAAYLPTILAGLAIFALEARFAERADWRPNAAEIFNDAAFMGVVMVALPRLLSLAAVLAIAGWRHADASAGVWPHQWPLVAQVILMILAVDLLRYWLHRACHRFTPLWRLHEVHHSPDLLYVVNVGRFHPLEKALHFTLDTVPFLVLGVAPEVMAGYFVVYSINGFFQHSNLQLRYGWLNYLVGSAETHRWHHARDPRLAACNFGSTTVLWDLAFGTWRLPGKVGEVGIPDRAYPKGFVAQLVRPFRDGPMKVRLEAMERLALAQLARDARDPMRIQRQLLERILRANTQTRFGREHGFAGLRVYEDFAKRVPVAEFEALRPYIDAEIETGAPALTREGPLRYVRTSGTTGVPKDVPLTDSHLCALRDIHRRSVAFQYRQCPDAFEGAIFAMVSPAIEGRLANGKPFGSASGVVAGDTPAHVREKFVLPPEVLAIEDSQVKYLLALRLAIARDDMTYMGTANPSTLHALAATYREHRVALVRDVAEGGFFLAHRVPPDAWRAVKDRLGANAARARVLASLGAAPRLSDLWPRLAMVVTWTCASAGISAAGLRRELDAKVRVLELGYLSSEFRGTVTVGKRRGTGAPTIDTHFFEFAERERWDRGERELVTLEGLVKGRDYYLVVTTPSGLYRYFINDVVRVTGFLHRLPLLRFVQKGKGVTNITGEKLCEAQVLEGLVRVFGRSARHARFAMALADEDARRYCLYVEPDTMPAPDGGECAAAIDAELAKLNIEYAAKRESGRLLPMQVAWLKPGAGERFKASRVAGGQREGQFKMVALDYRARFDYDLEAEALR